MLVCSQSRRCYRTFQTVSDSQPDNFISSPYSSGLDSVSRLPLFSVLFYQTRLLILSTETCVLGFLQCQLITFEDDLIIDFVRVTNLISGVFLATYR